MCIRRIAKQSHRKPTECLRAYSLQSIAYCLSAFREVPHDDTRQ